MTLEEIKAIQTSRQLAEIAHQEIINPTLLNSITNIGDIYELAGYYKDAFGIVHLTGVLAAPTLPNGSQLFVLAEGYVPSKVSICFAINSGSVKRVDISNNGYLTLIDGCNAGYLSLCGITFKAGD